MMIQLPHLNPESQNYEQQVRSEMDAMGGQQPIESTGSGGNSNPAVLVSNIEALLALDAAGALVPHGIGGHARSLLKSAAALLQSPALPVGELTDEQRKAAAICLSANKVSVSMVQRTMNIGYNAAQELCQSIIDAGLVPGVTIAPSLRTAARSQPASEPTPKMHLLDTPEPDKYVDCGEARPLPMFHLSTLLQYGARLTAANPPASEQASVSGWKLVPVEPTDDMLRAGRLWDNLNEGLGRDLGHATESYRAMLAAAPEVKP